MNLLHYKKAAFPAVAVETCEEERFLRAVMSIKDTEVLSIAACGGLKNCRKGETLDPKAQFPTAFEKIKMLPKGILVVYDYQHIIRNPGAYRIIKEAFPVLKDIQAMIVLVAPSWQLPPELQHDIPVLQYDLPSREALRKALDVVSTGSGIVPDETESLLDAAAGLSLQEAENAFALSLIQDKAFVPQTVEREKMRLVKSSGFLEVSPVADPATIGGMDSLKQYIHDEVLPSKGDSLLQVRGILLVGVPGTGKSLASRAVGSLLNWPVLRMDMSGLKGSLVGQSESNLRQALKLADAVAPAVLWLDEIEKAVGGYASSANSDGGTTLGMVGALLTWMQEHKSSIIVVATCNDYQKLPAELTRAGRFDERFFVDLPSLQERIEISLVHLKKYADCADNDKAAAFISSATQEWTGAEIEQLVKSASRRTGRKITQAAIETASKEIRPISRVKADEIGRLREWAKDSLRMANTPDNTASRPTSARRLDLEGEP